MFNISLEAMQATVQSRLGKELDALWQAVIDYRDSELQDVSYRNKYLAIRKFFKNNTVPKFRDIVWKYIGFDVSEVVDLDVFSTGSFCTCMLFDKAKCGDRGTLQIENTLDADYILKSSWFTRLIHQDVFTANELMTIADSFDKVTGGIKVSARHLIQKWCRAILGFDLTLGFMLEDTLPANSGVSNFTAREITAIVLHEIGHNLTLIEHAGDCYARVATFKHLEKVFKQKNANNIEEAKKLALKVSDRVAKIDKTNADRIKSVVEKFDKDISKINNPSAKKDDISILILGLIETAFAFVFDTVIIPKNILLGNQQSKRFANQYWEQHHKLSDIPVNGRLVTWMERKADEYAMLHGYGSEIVEGLDKIGKWAARVGLSEKAIATINDAERKKNHVGFFESIKLIVCIPHIASDFSYALYPAGSKRFREVLNTTIQKLKQYSTDPNYVAKYMKDCERILAVVDNPDSKDEYVARLYKSYDLFLKYVSVPSIIDWIVHGRVRREIEDLVNDIDAIGNNLMFYYGNKLQQIANNK